MTTDVEFIPTKLADGKSSSLAQFVITKGLTTDGSIVVLPVCNAEEEGHFKPLEKAYSLSNEEAIKIAVQLLKLTNDE